MDTPQRSDTTYEGVPIIRLEDGKEFSQIRMATRDKAGTGRAMTNKVGKFTDRAAEGRRMEALAKEKKRHKQAQRGKKKRR